MAADGEIRPGVVRSKNWGGCSWGWDDLCLRDLQKCVNASSKSV